MNLFKRLLRKLPPKLQAVIAVLITPPFIVYFFVSAGAEAVCEAVEGYWSGIREVWEGRTWL